MTIIPFDRQIDPQVVKSPFLRGIKGPGFFAEARQEFAEDYEDEEEYEKAKKPIGTGRKGRPPGPSASAQSYGSPSPGPGALPGTSQYSSQHNPYPAGSPAYPTSRPTAGQTPIPGASASGNIRTPAYRGPLPPSSSSQQPQQYARTPPPGQNAGTPTAVGRAQYQPPPPAQAQAQGPQHHASISSRSITAAMGGAGMSDQVAVREYLPLDVGKWISSPPRFLCACVLSSCLHGQIVQRDIFRAHLIDVWAALNISPAV